MTTIHEHEGQKYLRRIHAACPEADGTTPSIEVDVYSVLEAFGVTCPARQHALKKILCAGTRGKGSEAADLIGAIAALNRAVEMQHRRDQQRMPIALVSELQDQAQQQINAARPTDVSEPGAASVTEKVAGHKSTGGGW